MNFNAMNKKALLMILCLMLCSCKTAPTDNKVSEFSSKSNTSETTILIIGDNDYTSTTSNSIENKEEPPIEIEYPTSIDKTIETDNKKLVIDAEVIPPISDKYITGRLNGSSANPEEILYAFFGKRAGSFVSHTNDGYILDPDIETGFYSTAHFGEEIVIDTHYYNINPELPNRIFNPENISCNLSLEDAIEICDNFLIDSNISDYKLSDIHYFGATASPYYKLYYTFNYNGNIVAADNLKSSLVFYVCDDGLIQMEGHYLNRNDLTQSETYSILNLLTLDDAITILSEQIENVGIGCKTYSPYFESFSPEGLGLLEIPICEIYFGYYYENYSISPAWIFVVGNEEKGKDLDIFLAVDAINGEVIS